MSKVFRNYQLLYIGVAWSFFIAGIYFYNFKGGLSSDSSDWSNFTVYLTGLLTLPASIFAAYYSIKNFTLNSVKDIRNTAEKSIALLAKNLDTGLNEDCTIGELTLPVKSYLLHPTKFSEFCDQVRYSLMFNLSIRATVAQPLLSLSMLLKRYEDQFGRDYLIESYIERYRFIFFKLSPCIANLTETGSERDLIAHFWPVFTPS